jgi:hypothetical protein
VRERNRVIEKRPAIGDTSLSRQGRGIPTVSGHDISHPENGWRGKLENIFEVRYVLVLGTGS